MASGVDDARGALEDARAELRERTGSRDAAVHALETARTRAEETAGRLEALQEGETRYQAALSASKDAEAALARSEGELRELSARLEAARDKARELEGVRSRIGEHSRGLQDLEDLEMLEERLEGLQGELKEAMGDLERHRARLQAAEEASARHGQLRKALEEAVDPAEDLERVGGEVRALREEAILLDHQVETLRVEEEAIGREDEELTALEGEAACPKCMQPLTEEHLETLLEANRGRRREISSRLREKAARRNRLDDAIQEREGNLEELTALAEERRRMSVELERTLEASAELEDLVERVKAHPALRLEGELRELEGARDPERLSMLRRLSGTVEELRAAEARLVLVLEGLPDLERSHEASHRSAQVARKGVEEAKEVLSKAAKGRDAGALDQVRREHQGAVSARSACEAEAARAEERLEAARREVERLEGEVGRMEGIMDRQALHQHVSAWLSDRVIPAVRSMERSIMSMMSEEMDEAAGRWFGLLVDDPDLVLSVDEDFVPSVTHEDFEMDLPALSGGERTAAAFAYRLALNGLVRSNATPDQRNLLILDEPTDGFSREQLSRMGSLLEDLAAEQVVLVSHDRELRAFADRVYVVEKSGGSSSIHQAT
jgi:exonuclease SbcC